MFDMILNSIQLFFQGRFFKDINKVIANAVIGIFITAVCLIVLAKLGIQFWLAAVLACFIGGAIQPYLFKNLKYA